MNNWLISIFKKLFSFYLYFGRTTRTREIRSIARSTDRNNNREGQGNVSLEGCGKSSGSNYSSQNSITKKELYSALEKYIFDYGHKAVINRIKMTWEKIIQYIGTIYGQNISNKL